MVNLERGDGIMHFKSDPEIVSLEHDPEIVSLEHDPGLKISNAASQTVFLSRKAPCGTRFSAHPTPKSVSSTPSRSLGYRESVNHARSRRMA
jgi:hypothetical protein